MAETLYAYTWFRRGKYKGPGNWVPCTATMMASVIRYLHKRKVIDPLQPGEILHGSPLSSNYDFIYVQTPLPLEIIQGLEEV